MSERSLLYVDDNEDDHLLFEHAVRSTATPFRVQSVLTDVEALNYLRAEHPFSDRQQCPFPDFLLCDYDLGRTTGATLIRAIRQIPACSKLCIIVFSSVVNGERMPLSYAAGADYFLCKPSALDRLKTIVRTLWACVDCRPHSFNAIAKLPEFEQCPHHESRLAAA